MNFETPIHGVGLQSHFTITQINDDFINGIGTTIDDLNNYGFIANITNLILEFMAIIKHGKIKIAYKKIVPTAFPKIIVTLY